ncbi:galactokinase [Puteibacter caeruleilacunae]|nr:galactokinase [Puteibacter caeruleilacunae]
MSVDIIKNDFLAKYGEGEVSVYFSPGRVNLIGEHTDYNGGFVFPCALSFGTSLAIRKTSDKKVKFASRNMDFTVELGLDELTSPVGKEWVNYPLGVINQFMKRGINLESGVEMLFDGNVPNGAGLSSSAALEVVTAYAINDLFGYGIDRVELVKMSQGAENEFVGVNCGIMDQFASCMGKENHAIFLNCDTLEYELVPVELNGVKVIISNTNSPHKLDAGKYNERVAECHKAVELLNGAKAVKNLGELSPEEFETVKEAITDETALRRATHVVSEIKRTTDAVVALKAGELEIFGKLMNASHESLRDDYEVTGNALDTMAEEAWKIEGVIGSRMTGGGFGGCTVSLVKDEAIDNFIETVGKNYEARTGLKPEFFVAEIGDGARKIC